ncbi:MULTISPECIES: pentapeptide repeat-containing protein [Vagococcus]|uniref:Pentapeptide repeat family protein n=1 Tax=Vagococcus fluvialis bH819 TaxID=1255619 RepID=A0A1X6WS31_9ENTE|nr:MULTISPECIES: pentapeptide repeat-containing protein [Vagococcus]SLM87068.1 hypothetical protein FM121_13300 [Vagococcus fluvialis bH819]HCM90586.1 pentapeptide repeat-containing protein [Vagococcus sp.]
MVDEIKRSSGKLDNQARKNTFANSKERYQNIIEGKSFTGEADFNTFKDGYFQDRRFVSCHFDKIMMSNSDFEGAYFSDCKFSNVNLSGSSLKGAVVLGSRFDHANLTSVDLEGAIVKQSVLTNQTNLSNASLLLAKFDSVNLDSVVIGQSVRFLDHLEVSSGGATREENKLQKSNVIEKLNRPNFNRELDPEKSDLKFNDALKKGLDVPESKRYYENMLSFYADKYKDIVEIENETGVVRGYSIGENKLQYHSDTKEVVLLDMYGVTGENTSTSEHDWKIHSPYRDNMQANYIESFVAESIKAYEIYEIMGVDPKTLNNIQTEALGVVGLKEIAKNEVSYNLSDSLENHNDPESWNEELAKQSNLSTIEDLNIIVSVSEFYKNNKSEIEKTIDGISEETAVSIRESIPEKKYEERVSTIAYNKASSDLLSDFKKGNFEIPVNKNISSDTKSSSLKQSFEIE